MALNPVTGAATRLAAAFTGEVRLAAPLLLRQDECLFEEVFLTVDVLGYGIGTVRSATESGPFFSAQPSAVVPPIGVCT